MSNKHLTDEHYDNLSMVLGYPAAAIKREIEGAPWRTHGEVTKLLLDRIRVAVPEQVYGLLLNTYKSPFTGQVFPLRRLGDDEPISWNWNEYTFEQGVASEVEQEGLARLHTYSQTSHGARMVRRGLAIKIEENFYRAKEGIKLYSRQIEQMATSILRTHELDIMLELLMSPARSQVYNTVRHNQIYGMSLSLRNEDRLKQQADCFGMVNKNNDSGFTNLAAFLIGQMKHAGVDPDCIIVPPHLINYYYATNKSLTRYDAVGPGSNLAREIAAGGGLGENGFRRDTFNGLSVIDLYVQRMVGGGEQNPATELLTVPKQIGEFYPMMTRDAVEDGGSFETYHHKQRNIYMYDENLDRIVRVDYINAMENCLRFNKNGNLDPHHHKGVSDLFTHGADFDPTDYWGQMTDEWLTVETVANVVTTIKNRILDRRELETHLSALVLNLTGDGPQLPPAKIQEVKQGWDKIYATLKDAYLSTMSTELPNSLKRDGLFKVVTNIDYAANLILPSPNVELCPTAQLDPNFARFLQSPRSPLDKILTFLFLLTPINLPNIKSMHKNNIYIPVDFVLARPYMTYATSSVIILKLGSETGETCIAQEKFQMTTNVADRMLYANIFYYSKAILRNPRNVIIAPNVFIQNYMHGTTTEFITDSPNGALREIHENGGLMTRRTSESILAFATKVNDPIHKSNAIDIRGENKDMPSLKKYATAAFYRQRLNIPDESVANLWTNHQDYENGTFDANTICMLGHVENSERRVVYQCMGHLGPVTVDGVGCTRKPGMYGAKPLPIKQS
jgi:hypothetical protein